MKGWFKIRTRDIDDELKRVDNELPTFDNSKPRPPERNSLRVNEYSVLDTSFFQAHSEEDLEELKYDLLSNVCICMIDIVGFSMWCSNHLPNVIAKAMLEYNDWIGESIQKYPCVSKIELVGDSCMLVAGRVNEEKETLVDSYLSMIRMAVDLLEDLHSFKNIFKSARIGIRVGIHVSDVIGIYLRNPCKYQMFGNDINVCSRLESSCIPNSIHVSEKTLMCVQNACISTCGPCSRCVKGHVIHQNYKGVGYKSSYQLFLRKPEIYLVNTNRLFTKQIEHSFKEDAFRVSDDLDICISDCQSYLYKGVVVNVSNERSLWDDIEPLVAQLKSNRHFTQHVCVITTNVDLEDEKRRHEYDFEHMLSFETDDFYEKLGMICNEWKTSKSQRGSLDLTLN